MAHPSQLLAGVQGRKRNCRRAQVGLCIGMCLPNHNVAAFRGAVAFPCFFSSFLTRSCSPRSTPSLRSALRCCLCPLFLLQNSSPNCSFLVSVSVSPEDLWSFAGQLTISSRFTSPTTVISHLKHSRPLTDRRCRHSRYHQLQHLSNVLQNNGAKKAKMDIFFTCFAGLGPQCSAGPKRCQAGAGGLSWLSSEEHQEESLCITSTVQQRKAAASRRLLLPLIFLGTQTLLLLIKKNTRE